MTTLRNDPTARAKRAQVTVTKVNLGTAPTEGYRRQSPGGARLAQNDGQLLLVGYQPFAVVAPAGRAPHVLSCSYVVPTPGPLAMS
jgi:hypothetical protein